MINITEFPVWETFFGCPGVFLEIDFGDIQMLKNTSIKFETPAFMVQTSNEISYNNDIV